MISEVSRLLLMAMNNFFKYNFEYISFFSNNQCLGLFTGPTVSTDWDGILNGGIFKCVPVIETLRTAKSRNIRATFGGKIANKNTISTEQGWAQWRSSHEYTFATLICYYSLSVGELAACLMLIKWEPANWHWTVNVLQCLKPGRLP